MPEPSPPEARPLRVDDAHKKFGTTTDGELVLALLAELRELQEAHVLALLAELRELQEAHKAIYEIAKWISDIAGKALAASSEEPG